MDYVPPLAQVYLPALVQKQKELWPAHPLPSTLAAQIEQETCISLKSRGCWNPRTELKTDREYGFGLGQITITSKFDNFKYVQSLDKALVGWKFEDRYNASYQIHALVVWDKRGFDSVIGANTLIDQLAMSYAAYNGGQGGLSSDRRICAATPGCNKNTWFNNVELTSLKKKSAAAGYGQSFYAINRGYVTNIMKVRRLKYDSWF
ncbi:MAG TPA: hypothetical protein VGC12_00355 [Methyloradius sp.]